jgi:hypothetical protein
VSRVIIVVLLQPPSKSIEPPPAISHIVDYSSILGLKRIKKDTKEAILWGYF